MKDGGTEESGGGAAQPDDPRLAHYDLFRCYITHEDNLINHRMSWFIQLHSFLIAAYMFVVGSIIAALSDDQPGPMTGLVCLIGAVALFGLAEVGKESSRATRTSVMAADAAIRNLSSLADDAITLTDTPRLPKLIGGGDPDTPGPGFTLSAGLPTYLLSLWQWAFWLPFALATLSMLAALNASAMCNGARGPLGAVCDILP